MKGFWRNGYAPDDFLKEQAATLGIVFTGAGREPLLPQIISSARCDGISTCEFFSARESPEMRLAQSKRPDTRLVAEQPLSID